MIMKRLSSPSPTTQSGIELRSEKVRRLIGPIPQSLTRWGIAVIVIISLALLLVLIFVPFPYGHGESLLRHLL